MSEDGQMLAWANVMASSRPQRPQGGSCPFIADGPTRFFIEQSGTAAKLLIHWCDIDVVRTAALMEPVETHAGQIFGFVWIEPVWLVHGERGVELPGVTIHEPVAIGVPAGGIGVRAGA